jgi:tetratricopeptide (TPR) repeat protein
VPTALTPLYELSPDVEPRAASHLAALGIALALAVAAGELARRGRPALLVASLAYLVLVAPVSGLLHIGTILVADRYSYLSTTPFAMLLGGAVALIASRRRPVATPVAACVLAVWIAVLAGRAWAQTQIWRDTETLWRAAIAVDPACALCHSQLGSELGNRGRLVEATAHFAEAVRLRPEHPPFHRNLALALLKSGRAEEATARYRQLVGWFPEEVESLTRLGAALLAARRPEEAVEPLERAAELRPREREVRYLLARAYAETGRLEAARAQAEAIRAVDARLAEQILADVAAAVRTPTGAPPAAPAR